MKLKLMSLIIFLLCTAMQPRGRGHARFAPVPHSGTPSLPFLTTGRSSAVSGVPDAIPAPSSSPDAPIADDAIVKMDDGGRGGDEDSKSDVESVDESASSSIVFESLQKVDMNMAEFKGFIDSIPTAVIIASKVGKILAANIAASRLLGYSTQELEGDSTLTTLPARERMGKLLTDLMPPEIAHIHSRFLARRTESGVARIQHGTARNVVIKTRFDKAQQSIKLGDIPDPVRLKGERIYRYGKYTEPDFMVPASFGEPQRGFAYRTVLMSLGTLKIGCETYYAAFIDSSTVDALLNARKASVVAKMVEDAIGHKQIAQQVLAGSASGEDIRPKPYSKEGTVVFADMVGSTAAMCDHDAEEVFRDLDDIIQTFDAILASSPDSVKIKTIGDGYMFAVGIGAEEGSSKTQSDYLQEAIRLANRFQEAVKTKTFCGAKVALRVGMHSGTIMGGILGSTKMSFDIVGPTVSIASRMESKGIEGQIQLSEYSYRLLPDDLKDIFSLRREHGIRTREFSGNVYITTYVP